MNVAPILMPPSWMVLVSFYFAYPSLDPLHLSLIGATTATCGRFLLTYISSKGRRFIGEQRRASLDVLGRYLSGKKYVYFLASFIDYTGKMVFSKKGEMSNELFINSGALNQGLYFVDVKSEGKLYRSTLVVLNK